MLRIFNAQLPIRVGVKDIAVPHIGDLDKTLTCSHPKTTARAVGKVKTPSAFVGESLLKTNHHHQSRSPSANQIWSRRLRRTFPRSNHLQKRYLVPTQLAIRESVLQYGMAPPGLPLAQPPCSQAVPWSSWSATPHAALLCIRTVLALRSIAPVRADHAPLPHPSRSYLVASSSWKPHFRASSRHQWEAFEGSSPATASLWSTSSSFSGLSASSCFFSITIFQSLVLPGLR